MKILIDDLIQRSNANPLLKTAALAETYGVNAFVITLDDTYDINCVGVGYTDAQHITVNGEVIQLHLAGVPPYNNGLYMLATPLVAENTLTVSHDGTYLGRFAAGAASTLYASPTREMGLYTTQESRVTKSGQVVPALGGYCGRKVILDFRYKINSAFFDAFALVYADQIAKGLPSFIYFDHESAKVSWLRLYASVFMNQDFLLQSSVNRYLYSIKLTLIERF
jgi:hypothetical protein